MAEADGPTVVPSSDGVRVAVHDLGGSGPPVLFCHATGFHGRVWQPVADALADRYRCLGVDLRGHGDSVVPDGVGYHWDGMARDVLAVIDGLELGAGVRAVGHSLGGAVLVLAELQRPGAIGRAYLFEPIIVPPDVRLGAGGDNPMVAAARKRREVFDSVEAAIERYSSRPPFAGVDPRALRAYVEHGFRPQEDGTIILKCRGEVEAQVFASSQTDIFVHLGEVGTEVVVGVSGDGDLPATLAAGVVEALPRASLDELPDLTHFGPLEDPDRVARHAATALR